MEFLKIEADEVLYDVTIVLLCHTQMSHKIFV